MKLVNTERFTLKAMAKKVWLRSLPECRTDLKIPFSTLLLSLGNSSGSAMTMYVSSPLLIALKYYHVPVLPAAMLGRRKLYFTFIVQLHAKLSICYVFNSSFLRVILK